MVGFSSTSIDKAMMALELLAASREGLSLSTIADALELPKSGAHRILAALARRGYVSQAVEGGSYTLTLRLASVGVRFLEESRLPDVCQPVLDKLAVETGELVRMAVLENERLITVAKAQGARCDLRYDPSNSREIALYATASGQCWLALLPEAEALRIARDVGLGRRSDLEPPAARTAKQLIAKLQQARKRGFGQQIDEAEAHVSAVAVPIIDVVRGPGHIVGTVSVAGPSPRMPADYMRKLIPAMKTAADELATLWPIRRRNASLVRPDAA